MKRYLLYNEIRASLFLSLVSSLILYVLLIIMLASFPININIENDTLKKLFYFPDNINDSNSYYCFLLEYFIILGSIFTSIVATKVIVHDKKSGYDEYLFSLPIKRSELFLNKIVSIVLIVLTYNLLFLALSFISNFVFDLNIKNTIILKLNLALLISNLTFASIGVLIGSFIKPSFIYIKCLMFNLVLLILSIPDRLLNFKILQYANPFSYFKLYKLLNNSFKNSFIIASGCIIVFSISISKTMYDEYDVIK